MNLVSNEYVDVTAQRVDYSLDSFIDLGFMWNKMCRYGPGVNYRYFACHVDELPLFGLEN